MASPGGTKSTVVPRLKGPDEQREPERQEQVSQTAFPLQILTIKVIFKKLLQGALAIFSCSQ